MNYILGLIAAIAIIILSGLIGFPLRGVLACAIMIVVAMIVAVKFKSRK